MRFKIKTLEYWETVAEYTVEAESYEEATEMVRRGDVAYDSHEHPGNDDAFSSILQVDDGSFCQECGKAIPAGAWFCDECLPF